MANSWYSYLGAGKDPLIPSSYRRVTTQPQCVCGTNICAIYLQGVTATTPSAPLSTNMLNYISDALVTGNPQPTLPGGGIKLFVYLRNGCCG